MRLSSKPSDALGLRKMSSVRSGVGSPNAEGAGSPFQPASQRKPDGRFGASPVRLFLSPLDGATTLLCRQPAGASQALLASQTLP